MLRIHFHAPIIVSWKRTCQNVSAGFENRKQSAICGNEETVDIGGLLIIPVS
jgi:hypothetical protein